MRQFRVGAKYDPALDPMNDKESRRMLAIFAKLPQYKKQLSAYKAGQKSAIKRGPVDARRNAREEAELQAAETVRLACHAIEHALVILEETPAPAHYVKHLQIKQIRNALFSLRTKSGVKFADQPETTIKKTALEQANLVDGKYVPPWERGRDEDS